MNKSLYRFGIFFLGLTVACVLFQNIAQVLFGMQLFTEASFVAWFVLANIIATTGIVVVLKYYHSRQYWSAFYTGMLSTISTLCYVVIFLIMILSGSSNSWYVSVVLIALFIGMVYSIVLMFSGSRAKIWLRIAGAYMLTINLILILSVGWPLVFKATPFNMVNVLGKIREWTTAAGSLMSIPFIMHFLNEIKLSNRETDGSAVKKPSDDLLITARTLALILAVVLGMMIIADGNSSIYWGKKNFESTKQLARLFEARNFVNSKGDKLRYRLLKPLNYDPKKQYPLLVCLPYGGQPGTDTIRQLESCGGSNTIGR